MNSLYPSYSIESSLKVQTSTCSSPLQNRLQQSFNVPPYPSLSNNEPLNTRVVNMEEYGFTYLQSSSPYDHPSFQCGVNERQLSEQSTRTIYERSRIPSPIPTQYGHELSSLRLHSPPYLNPNSPNKHGVSGGIHHHESNSPIRQPLKQNNQKQQTDTFLFFAGASCRYSLTGGCGWVVMGEKGVLCYGSAPVQQDFPSPIRLEYEALLNCLHAALKRGVKSVVIKGCSDLILAKIARAYFDEQPCSMDGYFNTMNRLVSDIHAAILRVLKSFQRVLFLQISTTMNAEAQKLADKAMQDAIEKMSQPKEVHVKMGSLSVDAPKLTATSPSMLSTSKTPNDGKGLTTSLASSPIKSPLLHQQNRALTVSVPTNHYPLHEHPLVGMHQTYPSQQLNANAPNFQQHLRQPVQLDPYGQTPEASFTRINPIQSFSPMRMASPLGHMSQASHAAVPRQHQPFPSSPHPYADNTARESAFPVFSPHSLNRSFSPSPPLVNSHSNVFDESYDSNLDFLDDIIHEDFSDATFCGSPIGPKPPIQKLPSMPSPTSAVALICSLESRSPLSASPPKPLSEYSSFHDYSFQSRSLFSN